MVIQSIKVGFFLATRQIRRSSKWTTSLIIFVMLLTFLNLVFIGGILIGLIEGSSQAYREQYSGDVLITALPTKSLIERSREIALTAEAYPEVTAVSSRYMAAGLIEAQYRERRNLNELPDTVATVFIGIDPMEEDRLTGLSERLVAGEYLDTFDEAMVLVGAELIDKYSRVADIQGQNVLENIDLGDTIRVAINGVTKEVRIKGIVSSKDRLVSSRVFFTERELRALTNQYDFNVGEIAIDLQPGVDPNIIAQRLKESGFDKHADIRTWVETQGTFFQDIKNTFQLLSLMVGSIGLIVASITIFIVIFINAITRRKFIGILKAIGISRSAIELSYIFQSIFYALIGSSIGLVVVYTLLKPYFDANPIDFPFSDGILVAPFDQTLLKLVLILGATLIAGFVPARMIIRKNTLDAILGR